MPTRGIFPPYSDLSTAAKIQELERLAEPKIESNPYVYGKGMAQLTSAAFRSYVECLHDPLWDTDVFLKKAKEDNRRFHLFLAALFDLLCNVEYVHSRLVNSRWIYCRRRDANNPIAYYSFLKQCPVCCLDIGLETRLSGAQHKPSSHHIGEITTTAISLLLKLIFHASPAGMSIAVITKQSHDVDVVAFHRTLLLLLEVKASPMASLPIGMELNEQLFTDMAGVKTEYRQHSLVDVQIDYNRLFLFMPHRNEKFYLPRGSDLHWPYTAATDCFRNPHALLRFYAGWLELFYAYSVHKTRRNARERVLGYLVNGWGDETDSNKTKPGLGRTDDIKKGTYQLLKFGAYYNDDEGNLPIRSALATNLDPLFLKSEYFDKISDVRWGRSHAFLKEGDDWRIADKYLHYLYNGVFAFNAPVLNDPLLQGVYDLPAAEQKLIDGNLEDLLRDWDGLPEVIPSDIPFTE